MASLPTPQERAIQPFKKEVSAQTVGKGSHGEATFRFNSCTAASSTDSVPRLVAPSL